MTSVGLDQACGGAEEEWQCVEAHEARGSSRQNFERRVRVRGGSNVEVSSEVE